MKNRALNYTIGFAFIGLIITLLVSYVQRTSLNTLQQNISYINLSDKVKNTTTNACLLFEKIIVGDSTIDFDNDVINKFTASRDLLQSAYDGKAIENVKFEKPDDEETKIYLKKTIHAIEKLTDKAKDRWDAKNIELQIRATVQVQDTVSADSIVSIIPPPIKAESSIDESDQNYKKSYKNFRLIINKLEAHLDKKGQYDTVSLKTLSWLVVIGIIIIFIVLGVLLYRILYRNSKRIIESKRRLEIQADAVDQLSGFIEAVSAGDYSVALKLSSDEGNLNNKLINMRDKLKENAESERKRSWSNIGLAQIGEILRVNSNVTELYDNIIRFIVKYTRSNQGGLFIINEREEDQRDVYLELVACYAYERKKFLTKKIAAGEGQVGLCFQEGQRIYLLDVPDQYIYITSGLGSNKPKSLLLIPMKINGEVYGVIELATFTKYEDFEIELIEKLAESIAATVSTVRVNESTRMLLEKTQQQAEEMKSQEEEIRQNIEELEATQEEMRRKQTMLEKELSQSLDQIETLKKKEDKLLESQNTFQAVVDNMPSAVFWKDKDLRYIGCNKVFLANSGFTTSAEIIGKTDFEMPWSEKADATRIDDLEVIRKRKPKSDVEEMNVGITGEELWTSISKVPIFNSQKEVIALLGIVKDITKLKQESKTG